MSKKLIAFDLDKTLTDSKMVMTDEMTEVLNSLLDRYQVAIVSGGAYHTFQKQILASKKLRGDQLDRLHLLPSSGSQYYQYRSGNWQQVYSENFTAAQKKAITHALNQAANELGFANKKTYGDCIEDRGGQITFSALGQDVVEILGQEGLRLKEAWDPDNRQKSQMRELVAKLLPDFDVRVGGVTSIDVTKPGVDKGSGLKKLLSKLTIKPEEAVYVGDRLQPGGNDYPVKQIGIECIAVSNWLDTAKFAKTLL